MKGITLCKTKRGFGFKIIVDGKWLYTSKAEMFKMLSDKANAVTFREITYNQNDLVQTPALNQVC